MDKVMGFAFPFALAEGGVKRADGHDKIRQNIRALLATRFGERVMLREYGTRIHSLVHDPNDEAMAVLVKRQLQECMLAWEPRVLVTNISFERREAELYVRLDYTHTSEPSTDSLLVPLA
ncbi:GPW/gp25 family protein [Lysobacter silvisoli]|uniref:Baseplate assembly protein n=1 Tax=Lysobacter silvisoli TaxID=2293254 RepID=A0A371K5T5_9GAMM|nr:GPW/gp25 family protein [Lysobacter silvisoli]RDZ29299.1 baseplate assembly protein [Lysobacter silvisoli]